MAAGERRIIVGVGATVKKEIKKKIITTLSGQNLTRGQGAVLLLHEEVQGAGRNSRLLKICGRAKQTGRDGGLENIDADAATALKNDDVNVILGRTWEKLLMAARCIASIEYPGEMFAFSLRQFGKRFVLRFANYTEVAHIAGRFTSGAMSHAC
ncbi:hypothetical protein pipiens_011832 [Culex pipiens pipiens]|uniref:Uncharacterized protein n=1 Tax=Culex pipiens pipiens TaxID=38569 RepID=A0ABD1D583_CULPP